MSEQKEQPNFLTDINSMLKVRAEEMKMYYDQPDKLRELYFTIAHDIAIVNGEYIDFIKKITEIKKQKSPSYTKISEFNRDIEVTDEYIIMKSCKITVESLEKVMYAVRDRADRLDSEAKGFNYN